ncbi:MAG: TolB family protein [Candidatus Zipacnadales bacterium]
MMLILALRVSLLLFRPATINAVPYVAYLSNVPVHSPSPEAKIVVVDLATGRSVSISEGLHAARSFAFAPGGIKIAFEAIEEGLSDLFVCAPDGSGRQNLTHTPNRWESSPVFIDDDSLVYLDGPDRTSLWRLEISSGRKQSVRQHEAFYSTPIVSPNQSSIAIVASEKLAGPGDIFLINLDGTDVRNLTNAPALYSVPCFTPDGQRLLFCFDGREIGGATRGLAVMPVTGGEPTLLANDGYPLARLSVSPDGLRVAYTCASAYHSTWINLVNLDGSHKQRLQVGPFHLIGWPSFAPDSKHLAYQGVYAAKYTVHVVDLETGEDLALGEGATGVNPIFSPR